MLEPDEIKVTRVDDKRTQHSATFTILKEDHTLGNALRMQLLADDRVLFAGYKIPHPLLHELVVKVRTTGVVTPTDALIDAVDVLTADIRSLSDKFRASVQRVNEENERLKQMSK